MSHYNFETITLGELDALYKWHGQPLDNRLFLTDEKGEVQFLKMHRRMMRLGIDKNGGYPFLYIPAEEERCPSFLACVLYPTASRTTAWSFDHVLPLPSKLTDGHKLTESTPLIFHETGRTNGGNPIDPDAPFWGLKRWDGKRPRFHDRRNDKMVQIDAAPVTKLAQRSQHSSPEDRYRRNHWTIARQSIVEMPESLYAGRPPKKSPAEILAAIPTEQLKMEIRRRKLAAQRAEEYAAHAPEPA